MNNNTHILDLCQDVIGILYKLIPFDMQKLALTNKYFYDTYKNYLKVYKQGNYILTPLQQQLINDMKEYYDSKVPKTFIAQMNISCGKTAAAIWFSLNVPSTVVILVPVSIIIQWINELIKLFGMNYQQTHCIAVLHPDYGTRKLYKKWLLNDYNPKAVDMKVVIASTQSNSYSMRDIVKSSILLIDEIHKTRVPNRFKDKLSYYPIIGLTASKATGWGTEKVIYKIYNQQEELPTFNIHHYVMGRDDIGKAINKIKSLVNGPYLIFNSDKMVELEIKHQCIEFEQTMKKLKEINNFEYDETLLINPSKVNAGLNLTSIHCVIFVYPTKHLYATVIQSLGRVTRTTSKYKVIQLYHLHESREQILLQQAMLSENTIEEFFNKNNFKKLANPRYHDNIKYVIENLLFYTTYEKLELIEPIYWTLLTRIPKHQFGFIAEYFSKILGLNYKHVFNILKKYI